MPVSSTTGKNSEQKNQPNSTSNAHISVSETGQFPNAFHFWNGDEYVGQFAVVRDKQKVIMQGNGMYKTSDGQTYEGLWENDCLKDKCRVTFPDRVVFSGHLEDMTIQGAGKYTFQEKVEIEGNFVDNHLVGEVHLTDPNRHVWKGRVDNNGTCVDFCPVHPFWQSVLSLPSKAAQLFYGEAEEEDENIWEVLY